MTATLHVATDNRGRLVLTAKDASAQIVGRDQHTDFSKAAIRRKAAVALGVGADVILSVVDRFRADQKANPGLSEAEYPVGSAPAPTFRVRDISGHGTSAPFKSFDDALTTPVDAAEPVIEWDGLTACAAVDIDFHGKDAPSAATAEAQAARIEPSPALSWITRNGGLRLIYFAAPPMTAHDLAAVAALQLMKWNHTASVEIISRTRRPPGVVSRREQSNSLTYLSRYYQGEAVAQELIDSWLAEHDMAIGGRYPHTRCPRNPSPRALANTEPVCVTPDGVHCYICAADSGRGFFPWASLCEGERIGSQLKACVENFVNWDHARLILKQAEIEPPEPIARAAYAAMLRCRHGDDPRIPMVFTFADHSGLVRMNGFWATRAGEGIRARATSKIIQALPAAYIIADNELKISPERAEWLSQPINLAKLGYPPLTPIWGCRLTRTQTLPADQLYVVMQTGRYRADVWEPRRPRYLSERRRMPESEARGAIERAYPGVDWGAVELLIAAKGCSEHRAGLPPMMFFEGSTGSGKTATIGLAAGICGDHVSHVVFTADKDRLFAGARMARECGSFLNFDEFAKLAAASRVSAVSAMEVVLSFDESALTHKMYVGPVPLGPLPVFIWTDTKIPLSLAEHLQIGRRVHRVSIHTEKLWEQSLAAYKIEGPDKLRFADDVAFADASNSILSCVIDRHFVGIEATDFADVAKALGYAQVRNNEFVAEREELIRDLFELLAVSDPKSGVSLPDEQKDSTRWQAAAGWRVVDMNSDSRAKRIWADLHDDESFESSRKIDEMDLGAVLGSCGVRRRVVFDARTNGNRVAMRFRSSEGRVFNGDLVEPKS